MPIHQAAHYMNCPLHELPITGVLLYLIVWVGIITRIVLSLDSSPCPACRCIDFYPACSESWLCNASIGAEPNCDGGGGYEGAGDWGVATVFLNKGWSIGNFDIIVSTARMWLNLEVCECQFNLATISWPKLPRLKYFNIFQNILGFGNNTKGPHWKKQELRTRSCITL